MSSILEAHAEGGPLARGLSPSIRTSRPPSTRSTSSRASRSKPDSRVAEPPSCSRVPTLFLSPQPRKPPNQKKVNDEWLAKFSKWADLSGGPPDRMLVDLWRDDDRQLSLLKYLNQFSWPEHEEESRDLQDFVGDDVLEVTQITDGDAEQQPKAWINHLLWLDKEARSMEISRGSTTILRNSDLSHALRPVKQPVLEFNGYVESVYRRLIYIADGDQSSVSALVRQATISQIWALGKLLSGYFTHRPEFSLRVEEIPPARVITFVYHMPYLVLLKEIKLDKRSIKDKRLRKTYDLSCFRALSPKGSTSAMSHNLFMAEAVMSMTVNVRDDRWWEAICFNDEVFSDESRIDEDIDDSEGLPAEGETESAVNVSRSRTGLKSVRLDQGDPILNDSNSYSHWEPRSYGLTFVHNQLFNIVQGEEALFKALQKHPREYKESQLMNTDASHQTLDSPLPSKEVKVAIDLLLKYLRKLLDVVRRQEEESKRFLTNDLGVEKPRGSGSWVLRHPLFVGLNNRRDLHAVGYCKGIWDSINKLHSLQHKIEQEIKDIQALREENDREMDEQQKVANQYLKQQQQAVERDELQLWRAAKQDAEEQRQAAERHSQAWSLRLAILQYVAHSLTIPINLYNIPTKLTGLPDSSGGLAGFTLGVTAVFVLIPLLAWYLIKLTVLLPSNLAKRFLRRQKPLLPKARGD